MSTKILQAAKKTPGGSMVVPLSLGVIVNTSFGNVLRSALDGTSTTYLQKPEAVLILAAFIFCNATTINFKRAGVTIYKGILTMTVKVGMGIITGLICDILFGEKSLLGPPTLAIVGALTNSSGGLYTALTGEYGDVADVDAVSILSISGGPPFTMVILGAIDVAKIPISILMGCIVPVIVGYILGDLDEDIHRFCESGATMLTSFFAFPPGVGLDVMDLLKAGGLGTLLGVACALITGLAGYLVYKLLRMDHPEVGEAIGTTAGNTAAAPASVTAVDATLLAVTEATTAQTTATIVVVAIPCPVSVSYLHKVEVRKRGRQRNNRYYHG